MTVNYTPEPQTIIWDAISRAMQMSKWLRCKVRLSFNQHKITICPTDTEETAVAKWDAKQKPSA